MKSLIHIFLTLLFLLQIVNAQEQHSYGPVKENLFTTVFQDNHSTGGHLVGKTAGGFPIRNFNFWIWDYNGIPTEAELTNVNIKFKAHRSTTEAFNFGIYAVPIEWEWPQTWFSLLNNDDYLVYSSSAIPVNGIASIDVTFIEGPLFDSVRNAIQSGDYYLSLGIKQYPESGGQWSINGSDGTSGWEPCIDLTINFSTPDNYYTFKNKIQSNESYGSLILNDDIEDPIPSGSAPVFLSWGTPNKIRTAELPFLTNWNGTGTTQKHNYWDLQSDTAFVLRYDFDAISSSSSLLKATFLPTSTAVIKNYLAEFSNTTLGNVGIIDPWFYYEDEIGQWVQDGAPHFYSSPINIQNNSIDSYGGVFLNQGGTGFTPPYYSVKADAFQDIPLTQTGKTHRFYFQNWSGTNVNFQNANNLETPIVFTSDGATAQANLKGTQLSGTSTGFSNSGQRKFIYTPFPYSQYHQVYSSMNSVWYEKADINYPETSPTSWQIMNNFKPLNGEVNSTEGKSPCIDYLYETHEQYEEDYFIYIVYEKRKLDGKYEIRLAKFDDNAEKYFDISVFSSSYTNYATFDAMPVVAVSRQSNDGMAPKIVVVWKQLVEGSASAGLYYMAGFDQGGSIQWTNNFQAPYKITSTDANSSYPTIAAYKNPNINNINFHLAYQQGTTQIKYVPIVFGVLGANSGTPASISTGSGWMTNIFPSISVNNNGPSHDYSYDSPKIVWSTGYVDGGALMFRQSANMSSLWSAFQSYNSADDILSPTISAPKYCPSGASGYDESFVFGCSELIGFYNFYISSDNLSSRQFLQTHGKDIQIANFTFLGNGFGHSVLDNNTRTSAPFTLENRWTTGSFKKENLAGIHSGRSGVVVKNDVELYFVLGDMKVNDESVDFTALEDTAVISNLSDLNNYLITNSFSVDDNSNLTYSVYYGLNDSLIVYNNLSNEDQIRFKVELIDAETELVIGTYDDVMQTKTTLRDYENISYQIAMNGIGNRIVKLRLSVSNNFNGEYALSNIYSYDQSLEKGNVKELSWDGEGVVKEYDLAQNFPNPFNPSTTIRYQIPQDGIVTLKIYDILGSEVATLVNEEKIAGKYEVNFNASSLASGVYIYKIQAGSFINSKKMILLK